MPLYDPAKTLEVTQGAIAQLIAKNYMDKEYQLKELTDTAIVDLGEKLELTEDGDFQVNSPADIVFKAFLSQLGKIVIDTRSYVAKLPSLYVDPVNWGLFSEYVQIGLSDVMIDEMWNPNGYIPWGTMSSDSPPVDLGAAEGSRIAAIEYGFYRPPIHTKLYKKLHPCMVAITTMYDQLFTAFRSVTELNKFLAGLYNAVENTIQLKAEIYAKMTVCVGIGKTFVNNNAFDLRAMYAAEIGDNTVLATPTKELKQTPGFQAFALEKISEYREYISDYVACFNNGEEATFASDVKMIINTNFEKCCKFGVRANTYNENLLGIGSYDRCNAWQAVTSGTVGVPVYDFETTSSIDFSKEAAIEIGLLPESTTEKSYLLTGVVAVIYDRMAMGITIDKKKVTSTPCGSRDTVNLFYHAAANYVVNDSYPIISFYISEPTT